MSCVWGLGEGWRFGVFNGLLSLRFLVRETEEGSGSSRGYWMGWCCGWEGVVLNIECDPAHLTTCVGGFVMGTWWSCVGILRSHLNASGTILFGRFLLAFKAWRYCTGKLGKGEFFCR